MIDLIKLQKAIEWVKDSENELEIAHDNIRKYEDHAEAILKVGTPRGSIAVNRIDIIGDKIKIDYEWCAMGSCDPSSTELPLKVFLEDIGEASKMYRDILNERAKARDKKNEEDKRADDLKLLKELKAKYGDK